MPVWASPVFSPNCTFAGGESYYSPSPQALEALAILVALREWSAHWKGKRVQLVVRTDNVAALTLVCKMQPHSEQLGRIAREMALDIGESTYSPDDVAHIAGISNVGADILSRQFLPNSIPPPLPPYLPAHLQQKCAPRGEGWWRCPSR